MSKHPHMRYLAEVSELANLIATRLFQLGNYNLSTSEPPLLIITVDVDSDLYYAPVTNIDPDLLANIFNTKSRSAVLEFIRNQFPISTTGTHLVGEIIKAYFSHPTAKPKTVWLLVDDDGYVKRIDCINDKGESEKVPSSINEIVHSYQRIFGDINDALNLMKKNFPDKTLRFLLLRPDKEIISPKSGRRIRLGQVGVVFASEDEGEINPTITSTVRTAILTSSFAALTLFYEKERYFQKALRHSKKGQIVKTEQTKYVREQVGRLQRLRKRGESKVPEVLTYDGEMGSKRDDEMSWYLMTRYELLSLLDLFAQTPGLQDYEVRNITRSAFRHLSDTYWGSDVDSEKVATFASILAAASLARDKINQCINSFIEKSEAVRKLIPVSLNRSFGVFPPSLLNRFTPIFDFLAKRNGALLHLEVEWNEKKLIKECQNPLNALNTTIINLLHLDFPSRLNRARIHEGEIHGDSHFANLLVDASIPEDPLIVSIDQTNITKYKDKEGKILYDSTPGSKDIAFNDFMQEQGVMNLDPTYDVAKLMLSSSCFYGLMYRHAFDLDINSGSPLGIKLSRAISQNITGMSNTGGISGADIRAIILPVPSESFRYHCQAAEILYREFLEYLKAAGIDSDLDLNFNLIRLWFLTIRHLFSISNALFPQDPNAAVGLFLWGTIFTNIGTETIEEITAKKTKLDPLEFAKSAFTLFAK